MSERIVHVIPNLQTKKYERKAVGIYARVSTAHSAQLHSISLQLSALVQRVYHTLNWQLADIYVDFASGKSASERSEFQRICGASLFLGVSHYLIACFNHERFRLLGRNIYLSYLKFNISSAEGGANLPLKVST